MSISRVTTWASGNILTASALNGEFDNIINNALALINPLTGNLNVNGNALQNVSTGSVSSGGLYFNNDSNTGIYSSATDTVDVTAGGVRVVKLATASSGVNYATITPGATGTGATLGAAGSDTDVSLHLAAQAAGSVTISSTNTPFVPAAVSGTPAQHALFRNNVVKGWISFNGTGTIAVNQSYNVTSITDNAQGEYTVTWDRDFAAATYAVIGSAKRDSAASAPLFCAVSSTASNPLAGAVQVTTRDDTNTAQDAELVSVLAMGGQ